LILRIAQYVKWNGNINAKLKFTLNSSLIHFGGRNNTCGNLSTERGLTRGLEKNKIGSRISTYETRTKN